MNNYVSEVREDIEKILREEAEERRIKDYKDYVRLKSKLEKWSKGKKKKYSIFVAVLAILRAFPTCMDVVVDEYKGTAIGLICVIIVSVGTGIIMGFLVSAIIETYLNYLRNKIIEYEVDNIQDEIQDDIFENAIKMSYKYLDQYYMQTKEQARKGFCVTVCVSVFGAILIGIGILAMFMEKIDPSYITCASGVITEFVAAIFFYLYNKTIVSMSKYHNKLVLSQNISIALKVADTLPDDDKTESKKVIISELLKDINTYLIKSDSEDDKKSQK